MESCESRGYQRKYECGVRLNARFTEVYRTICCVRRGDIDLKYGLVNKKVAIGSISTHHGGATEEASSELLFTGKKD